MSFEDNQLFARTTVLQTLPGAFARIPHSAATQPGIPRFLVVRDKAFASWWGSLKSLCVPARLRLYTTPVRLFRNTPVARFRFAGRPLLLSVLLHIVGVLWYPYLPSWNFSRLVAPAEVASAEPAKIYYRLNLTGVIQKLPRVRLAGTRERPGSGLAAAQLPVLGSAAAHPKIPIVLRPPNTDNRKQTIHQSESAPELRITMDLKVLNLVEGVAVPPKPQIQFSPRSSRPIHTKNRVTTEPAPELNTSTSPSVIPLSELASVQLNLPVPPPAPAATNRRDDTVVLADGVLLSKDPTALVLVGIHPSSTSPSLDLPLGNRWAELSIALTGGGAGSSGSVRSGSRKSGPEGAEIGGDRGEGAGAGRGGFGERGEAAGGGVSSISGEGSGGGSSPNPMLPANMVYPVPSFVLPRKNALVVSAGPTGGGGLDTYGALHCGKIYTVFLQMPGKSWTLQFCESKHDLGSNATRGGRSAVVRLESGLLPPDAELRFDFRRLPLPPESAHKLILLRGLILEDGTVHGVQVYRSVLPQMDEAARLAFSRWKFKPAMREGRPVSVEILVGIPLDAPSGGLRSLAPTHPQ